MAGTPSWILEKTGQPASTVAPQSLVRVFLPGSVAASLQVGVFSVAEWALLRLVHRLIGRAGRFEIALPIDPAEHVKHGAGVVSSAWHAAELGAGPKPSRFVALADGFPRSGPLRVAPQVAFDFGSPEVSADVDLSQLGPALGLPAPTPVSVSAKTGRKTLTGTAFAPVDPALELRAMTPSTTDWPLGAWLEAYLPAVAEEQAAGDVGTLLSEFYDEYGPYLENSSELGVELRQQKLDLDELQSTDVEVDLYPAAAGRTMLAVAAVDPATEQLAAVSDLIGLSVESEEEIYRDF